jgi:predicted cupin superfamily sugar epimerase
MDYKYTIGMTLTAKQIIDLLHLQPLPIEGGYFLQTYLAPDMVTHERYPYPKPFSSAIYYLLDDTTFSAMHRLQTDEVYHFYLGDPVELLLLYPNGKSEVVILGQDLVAGQCVQLMVPAGVWQGSRLKPGGAWSLLGTTMAPAFDETDFELGQFEALATRYPDKGGLIRALTR